MLYKGYIETIEENIAYCILWKDKEQDSYKYELEISVDVFKEKVKEGTPVEFVEDEEKSEIKVIKFPPWTKKDMEKAKKWAKKISKTIKWE